MANIENKIHDAKFFDAQRRNDLFNLFSLNFDIIEDQVLPTLKDLPSGNLNTDIIFPDRNKSICIDGTCCCGKTTIVSRYKRGKKINELYDMTCYNIAPILGVVYYFEYLKLYNDSMKCIFDRSPYSNLIWSLIWTVLSKHGNYKTITDIYEEFDRVLEMSKFYPDDIYVVFVINSDIDKLISYYKIRYDTLKKNKTQSVHSWQIKSYFIAQNICYYYFAKKFNYPLFDLKNNDINSVYDQISEKYLLYLISKNGEKNDECAAKPNNGETEKIKYIDYETAFNYYKNVVLNHSR